MLRRLRQGQQGLIFHQVHEIHGLGTDDHVDAFIINDFFDFVRIRVVLAEHQER
ncbi:hypothetical protein D3C85_1834470 [compost metagenome]